MSRQQEIISIGLEHFSIGSSSLQVLLAVTWRDRPARPTVDLVPYPFPEPVRRRADIESFARELEARGRVRATVTRRLCTIAGFCNYAVEEELIDHSPAAHVRCPRVDYESRAAALDRNELGALLVAAGLGSLAATSAQYGPMHVI